ncbi:MAG: uracil phosphoribosyltransferase [Acidimicrobiales bacterium]
MDVNVIDHPLVRERLTRLRKKDTKRPEFRRNLDELSAFLVYEAVRSMPVATIEIDTPLAPAKGVQVNEPPIIVPILRAGLGMLDGALSCLPNARVGFIGQKRDEITHMPHAYVNTVPHDLEGRRVLVLDPMLATGGSLLHTCHLLDDSNCGAITVVCCLVAPEGLDAVRDDGLAMSIFTASIDSHLNDKAFIVPGLGDAGDRQFGLN